MKTFLIANLLVAFSLSTYAQDKAAPPVLSGGAVERKVLALEEQSKQSQLQLQALQQIKSRLNEAIARIDALTYPPTLSDGIAAAKKKLIADKPPSGQAAYNELAQLTFQFNQKLASSVPDIPNQFSQRNPTTGSSVREQILVELFVDSIFADISLQTNFPFFSSPDQPLSDQSKQAILNSLDSLSEAGFNSKKNSLKSYVQKKSDEVNSRIVERTTEIKTISDSITSLYDNLDKSQKAQSRIDEALVQYGIPAIAFTMIALLLAPVAYRNEGTQNYILQSGVLIQIFTIFLLTSTILLLGFANKIESNSLGTLLGGIAGYVLGKTATADRPVAQRQEQSGKPAET